ncbi:MAG: hypothetical protein Q9227_008003 [Pyrenula ochraceoflavens]
MSFISFPVYTGWCHAGGVTLMDGESFGGGKYSIRDLRVDEKFRRFEKVFEGLVMRKEVHLKLLAVTGVEETKAFESAFETLTAEVCEQRVLIGEPDLGNICCIL